MVITLRPFRLGFFTFLGFFDRPSEAATYAIDAHGHSRALMRQEATNRQASLEEGDPDNDCVWGDWQDWTQCTVTCGNGMRTRQKSQESIGEEAVCEEPKMMLASIGHATLNKGLRAAPRMSSANKVQLQARRVATPRAQPQPAQRLPWTRLKQKPPLSQTQRVLPGAWRQRCQT
ncbi:unnamed protein product [Durusdinium trenchii]|uniref:Uncharacterized protein n=1 Tax=Durusdinium trenchii TaxID=1381693 RepID=A0ABP0KUF6_9DINO